MEPSPELKGRMLKLYDVMSRGDAAATLALYSTRPGILNIGTDPKEWWTDPKRHAEIMTAQLAELAGTRFIAQNIIAYREGSVGWTADASKVRLPDGSEVPFRFTAVWHLEGEEWKVVQSHTSFPVANEQAINKELTTEPRPGHRDGGMGRRGLSPRV